MDGSYVENYNRPREMRETDIRSLSDYLDFCGNGFVIEFWAGGYLRPYIRSRNNYQWVLYPIDLFPGEYRLCIMLVPDSGSRPVRAFSVVFAPGEKIPKKNSAIPLGYGFNMTPAFAVGNTFFLFQNITDFHTRFSGDHLIGISTLFWGMDIELTRFEVLLLRRRNP